MGISADSIAMVRARLADRIDLLAREASHLSVSRIAYAVDDIRREARASKLETLASLASGLERALATSDGTAALLPYLEAMSESLDVGAATGGYQPALLAAVGIRLHG